MAVVQAGSCSFNSTPSLGTSICCTCACPRPPPPKKRGRKKMNNCASQSPCGWTGPLSLSSLRTSRTPQPHPHANFKVSGRERKAVVLECPPAEEPSGTWLKMQAWGPHPWRSLFSHSDAGPRCDSFFTTELCTLS